MKSLHRFMLGSICWLVWGCAQGAPKYFEPIDEAGVGGITLSGGNGSAGMNGMGSSGMGGMAGKITSGGSGGSAGSTAGSGADSDAGSAGSAGEDSAVAGGVPSDAGMSGSGGSSAAGSSGSTTAGMGGTMAGSGGAPATEPNADCDSATFGGHTYWVCNDDRDWDEARAACMSAGSDLISIGSSDEESFIHDQLDNNRQYWIGLNQKNASGTGAAGTWEWSDGSALSAYENWDNGEPENDDCGQLNTPLLGDNVSWQARECDNNERFICESL